MKNVETEKVAQFIAEMSYEHIPEEAVRIAKKAILDWMGVTIAGSNEHVARIVCEQVRRVNAVGEAGVVCKAFQTSADLAAWANGTASHSLDFDDTFANEAGFNFHPTVGILPALLALGEKVKASGREVLASYIVGIEVEYRIGAAIGPYASDTGWHSMPVVGTMGSVAASSHILRLSKKQAQMALGIAGSLAGGLLQNFGTMTKPLHAGNSSRNGVVAALAAQNGLTAKEEILEGDFGFCSMFSAGRVKGLGDRADGLGKNWHIISPGMSFKPYPCCRSTHSSIDASLYLKNVEGVDASQVVRIICKTSPHHTELAKFHKPKSAYEGKFSIPYCIAIALLTGKVVLEDFTEEKVADHETQALLSKVEIQYPQEYKDNPMLLTGEVAVTLANGAEYSCKIDAPKGDFPNPMTDEELSTKFQDCTHPFLTQTEIDEVERILHNLESLGDISELMNRITVTTKSSE